MYTFLGLPKPPIDDDETDDDSRQMKRRSARPLPFLATCEIAQNHDLLVMNLREDLTDTFQGNFDIDFP